jgi:hypothetical protein
METRSQREFLAHRAIHARPWFAHSAFRASATLNLEADNASSNSKKGGLARANRAFERSAKWTMRNGTTSG